MPLGYPVFLELSGRRAVVIGAGAVSAGKVEGLLAAGARVTVVAERPAERLEALQWIEGVSVERRPWRATDLDGADVCVASSDDPGTRAAIFQAGKTRGVLMNVMDDVARCDFAAPAVVRRGDLVLAISTGGRSPALARRLREEIAGRFGPEWEQILEVLREVREETLEALPDLPERSRRWRAALDLGEAEELARSERLDELKA